MEYREFTTVMQKNGRKETRLKGLTSPKAAPDQKAA